MLDAETQQKKAPSEAQMELKRCIMLWGVYIFVTVLMSFILPRPSHKLIDFTKLAQIREYTDLIPESYYMHYGFREIWVLHPPNRIDLEKKVQRMYSHTLLPYRFSSAFDEGTTHNTTAIRYVTRILTDRTKWSIENDPFPKGATTYDIDAYGGWQSHIHAWNLTQDYASNCRVDIPVIIVEDDAILDQDFVVKTRDLIKSLPEGWAILSLDSQGAECGDYRKGKICQLKNAHLGVGYIVANATVASRLIELNDLPEPPRPPEDLKRLNGDRSQWRWRPVFDSEWKTYSVIGEYMISKRRQRTQFPHGACFTPL